MILLGLFATILTILYGYDAWNQFPQSPEIDEMDKIISILTQYVTEIALNSSGIPKNIRESLTFIENHPIDYNTLMQIVPELTEQYQLAAWNYNSSAYVIEYLNDVNIQPSNKQLKDLYAIARVGVAQQLESVTDAVGQEMEPGEEVSQPILESSKDTPPKHYSNLIWWTTSITVVVGFTALCFISN